MACKRLGSLDIVLENGNSAGMDRILEISLAPNLQSLGDLARCIEQFVAERGLGDDLGHRLNLTLDELVTNSISYSLPEVAEPDLRLRLDVEGDAVVAVLEDNGAPFNPFEEAKEPDTTLGINERQIGGLGVFFVKQLADARNYEREGERNRITLRYRIGGQDQ